MKTILEQCQKEDFKYISTVLDSYVSATNDSKRKELLNSLDSDEFEKNALIELIDKQIRYYGSSDLAYLFRGVFNDDAGISAEELINDSLEKLNVKIKKGGSVEAKLERIVKAVVEKELLAKSPDELSKAFEDVGMGNADKKEIMDHIKANGKIAILPVLIEVLGPKITLSIIETIIISLIAQIIGKEAAKVLIKELIKRNPWLNALGPIVWTLSAGWVAFDLQGPAYRKTIPIVLYLGIVALRDGDEDEKQP